MADILSQEGSDAASLLAWPYQVSSNSASDTIQEVDEGVAELLNIVFLYSISSSFEFLHVL